MTVRDLLQQELRKRGVTVVPEFSVSTPTGLLKPDILLKNGAPYVVETKLGAETKLLEAMAKLKNESFPSLLEQLKTRFPLRVEIDRAMLKVLSFGDDEINRILDYLYPALANEIQQPMKHSCKDNT